MAHTYMSVNHITMSAKKKPIYDTEVREISSLRQQSHVAFSNQTSTLVTIKVLWEQLHDRTKST